MARGRKKFTIPVLFGILKWVDVGIDPYNPQKECDTMVDCHMHMVLDGVDWKSAIARHQNGPDIPWIRSQLQTYQNKGFTHLRDGGDRWSVGAAARALAPEYGITYRTPLAPLCKAGHYGGFIGKSYANMREFTALVGETRCLGGDFIKIMISGLMDFNTFGALSEPPLTKAEIGELIHIAHEEGFAVMAHANGAGTMEAAAEAGVDTIEHGAYADADALAAMTERGTVWVPTLSTIGNLRGTGRFSEKAVAQILESALENVSNFVSMGGLVAPGTDAGAWAVPHGSLSEYEIFSQLFGAQSHSILQRGADKIQSIF